MSDPEQSDQDAAKKQDNSGRIAIGLALGVGLGAALDDVGTGIAIGIAIGAAIMASGKPFPDSKV